MSGGMRCDSRFVRLFVQPVDCEEKIWDECGNKLSSAYGRWRLVVELVENQRSP